jgi:hypothetical protein
MRASVRTHEEAGMTTVAETHTVPTSPMAG